MQKFSRLRKSQERFPKVVPTAQAYVSALQCPMRRHDGCSEQIRFRVVRWSEGPSNRDLRKPKECVRYHQMLCCTVIIMLEKNAFDCWICNISLSKPVVCKRTASHQRGNE
ncbi:hypothetical protein CDAR_63501 [Caerostris darwini]|uniref:Uncharacterized protein n=1 Tax=Caerostris darwini TaxID=1538125 RepID=A0AAV4QFV9_9ARAC|nr:hypothetical protein CDAR_63501 [Caerostris darwini]